MAAFAAGALGYLLKDSAPREIVAAVHKAAAGEGTVSGQITPRIIDGYRKFAQMCTETSQAHKRVHQLTCREREVLSLIGGGLSNREIAQRLVLSPETIKTHVSTIMSKLGTTSRVRAALIADRTGLLPLAL